MGVAAFQEAQSEAKPQVRIEISDAAFEHRGTEGRSLRPHEEGLDALRCAELVDVLVGQSKTASERSRDRAAVHVKGIERERGLEMFFDFRPQTEGGRGGRRRRRDRPVNFG
jgi:hypothetical protein